MTVGFATYILTTNTDLNNFIPRMSWTFWEKIPDQWNQDNSLSHGKKMSGEASVGIKPNIHPYFRACCLLFCDRPSNWHLSEETARVLISSTSYYLSTFSKHHAFSLLQWKDQSSAVRNPPPYCREDDTPCTPQLCSTFFQKQHPSQDQKASDPPSSLLYHFLPHVPFPKIARK